MIYNKDAVFPYPILSRTSNSYSENYFDFNVDLKSDTGTTYIFTLSYKISSTFLIHLLKKKQATLVLIIQSGDNYFKQLDYDETEFRIEKSRLSLSKRTRLQLQIETLEEITFSEAEDLNDFYSTYKEAIVVKRHSLLGYSDEVIFEGSEVKPIEIFEKTIREDLPIPFKVELTNETIMLVFKNKKDSLDQNNISMSLKNLYLYIGLNRALSDFLSNYAEGEESVDLLAIGTPEKGLHIKLRDLMLNKNITELDFESLDEVIQKISDHIIGKFTEGIMEITDNGD